MSSSNNQSAGEGGKTQNFPCAFTHWIKNYNNKITNRWISLSITVMLFELCAGSAYGFGIYSSRIASEFGWTDTQIQTLSSWGNVGLYLSVPAGLLFDYMGPTPTIIVGSLSSSIGYLLAFFVTIGLIKPNVVLMTTFFFFAWHGSTYLDAIAISLNIKNFPNDRGLVTGLVKSFFGFAGSLLAVTNFAFFSDGHASDSTNGTSTMTCAEAQSIDKLNNVNLGHNNSMPNEIEPMATNSGIPILLFLAVLNAVPLLVGVFVALSPASTATKLTRGGRNRLAIGYCSVTALAIYVAVVSFVMPIMNDNGDIIPINGAMIFAGMCVLLVGLMASLTLCTCECNAAVEESCGPEVESDESLKSVDSDKDDKADNNGKADNKDENDTNDLSTNAGDSPFVSIQNTSLLQTLRDPNYWLLWCTMFLCTGSGLMVINHLAQIAISFGGTHDSASVYVIIFGVANALGRMISGIVGDKLQHKISRPWLLAVAALMLAVGEALLIFDNLIVMYVMCVICGMSYGAFWSVSPPLTSELCGLKNLGANCGFLELASASGAYVYNSGLCANLYQMMARHHIVDGVPLLCCGGSCFRWTAIVSSGSCLLAACLMSVLACRTKTWYAVRSANIVAWKNVEEHQQAHTTKAGGAIASTPSKAGRDHKTSPCSNKMDKIQTVIELSDVNIQRPVPERNCK